jgi:hypothetical protein
MQLRGDREFRVSVPWGVPEETRIVIGRNIL